MTGKTKLIKQASYFWMALCFVGFIVNAVLYIGIQLNSIEITMWLIDDYSFFVYKYLVDDIIYYSVIFSRFYMIFALISSFFTFGIINEKKIFLIISEFTAYLNISLIIAISIFLIKIVNIVFLPSKHSIENYSLLILLLSIVVGILGLGIIILYIIYIKNVYLIKKRMIF